MSYTAARWSFDLLLMYIHLTFFYTHYLVSFASITCVHAHVTMQSHGAILECMRLSVFNSSFYDMWLESVYGLLMQGFDSQLVALLSSPHLCFVSVFPLFRGVMYNCGLPHSLKVSALRGALTFFKTMVVNRFWNPSHYCKFARCPIPH